MNFCEKKIFILFSGVTKLWVCLIETHFRNEFLLFFGVVVENIFCKSCSLLRFCSFLELRFLKRSVTMCASARKNYPKQQKLKKTTIYWILSLLLLIFFLRVLKDYIGIEESFMVHSHGWNTKGVVSLSFFSFPSLFLRQLNLWGKPFYCFGRSGIFLEVHFGYVRSPSWLWSGNKKRLFCVSIKLFRSVLWMPIKNVKLTF